MASMGCIVALPDKALFQGEITYANIPGTDGYFGVLPGHELTVSLNREGGVVTLTIGENEKREFLVMGGATSVLDDKVTVLARFGTAVEDIDAEAVRAEAAECKSAIAELEQKNDPQDQATLMTHQKKLEWCEAQLAHVGQAEPRKGAATRAAPNFEPVSRGAHPGRLSSFKYETDFASCSTAFLFARASRRFSKLSQRSPPSVNEHPRFCKKSRVVSVWGVTAREDREDACQMHSRKTPGQDLAPKR